MRAFVEERSQKSRGGSSGFGGPDRYVAVQVVPDGVKPLSYLNSRVAKLRGIEIIWCGEGYSRNQSTNRSSLVQARHRANIVAASVG